ncbi:MAG: hypothetical protein R2752_11595 [Vicinamibacterales bacterium]
MSKKAVRRLWLVGLVLAVGCASAPIRKDDLAALAAADAQVLQGCYDCLLRARETYARVGVGQARPLVVQRLFETELLLATREKELALDWAGTLDRARTLAPELPPPVGADRLIALVDALPIEGPGTPGDAASAFRRAHATYASDAVGTRAWLETVPLTPAVHMTLRVALDCAYPPRADRGAGAPPARMVFEPPPVPEGAPPLVEYQVAMCRTTRTILEHVRERVPAFVEAQLGISRTMLATAQNDGAPGLRERLDELYARFPDSPAVTYLAGSYHQLVGDCREALRFYDATIAIVPRHENAMLGRTICLTYLSRNDEAIATATRMVEQRLARLDQAHYWLAWNHRVLKDLPRARTEIERAKSMALTGEIFTLAGMIEHDQDDLVPAERDLKGARDGAYGTRNCVAAWYLGLVKMKAEQWAESSTWFEQAMDCYAQNVAESRAGLEGIQRRENMEPEFKARQIANFEATLAEDQSQYYAAAFNAANQGARGGRIDRARELIEIAARDPALADLVRQLREILKVKAA